LPRLGLRNRLGPGLTLYLLSGILAELCSGSMPPLMYLGWGWSATLMYGGGVVLIRELALRWGKGWPTVVALGIAYGIAEEGIAVRTFFDPTSAAHEPGVTYGWAGGVNWVFAAHLSLYHAIISIAIPILLVSMAYPERRGQPWVSGRWLRLTTAGFLAIFGVWLLGYQRPVQGGYLIASLVAIAAIVTVARHLPTRLPVPAAGTPPMRPAAGTPPMRPAAGTPPMRPAAGPWRVALIVFATTVWVFAMDWLQGLGTPFPVAMLGIAVLPGAVGLWLARTSERPGWSDRQRFAVVAGVLFLLVLFSPVMEARGGLGMLVVGAALALLLMLTWRRLRSSEAVATPYWGS
jgi:hypothetical protein